MTVSSVNGQSLETEGEEATAAAPTVSYTSCDHAWSMGQHTSGSYTIRTGPSTTAKKYCEMNIAGGGWTLVAHQSSQDVQPAVFVAEMSKLRLSPETAFDKHKYDLNGLWNKQSDYSNAFDATSHDELLFLTGNLKEHCSLRYSDVLNALSGAKEEIIAESCRDIYLKDPFQFDY